MGAVEHPKAAAEGSEFLFAFFCKPKGSDSYDDHDATDDSPLAVIGHHAAVDHADALTKPYDTDERDKHCEDHYCFFHDVLDIMES